MSGAESSHMDVAEPSAPAVASARTARHADYGQCWGEGAARCFSIEGDFLDEDQGVRLMPVPESFICPISLSLMSEPVAAVDGTVYERDYIERWIRQQRQDRKPIMSPVTGLELHSTTLMPLVALQRAIEAYISHRPELRQVPTEGRSFEEAAQVLQSDLIEKESRHLTTQGELNVLRAKNEELQRKLRASEEMRATMRREQESNREELQCAWARLRELEGDASVTALRRNTREAGGTQATQKVEPMCTTEPASAGLCHSSSSSSRGSPSSDVRVQALESTPQQSTSGARKSTSSPGATVSSAESQVKDSTSRSTMPSLPAATTVEKASGSANLASLRLALPLLIVTVVLAAGIVSHLERSWLHRSAAVPPSSPVPPLLEAPAAFALSASPSVGLGVGVGTSPMIGNTSGRQKDKKAKKNKTKSASQSDDHNIVKVSMDTSISRQVEELKNGKPEERKNAAFSLWNMAVGNPQNQVDIARAGAILPLTELLTKLESEVREAAAAVLGSLAEHAQYRTAIAEAGAIPPLIDILQDARAGARVVAARALWGLTAGNAANQAAIAEAGAIPLLTELLRDKVARVRVAAGAAICGLAIDHPSNQATIAKAGVIELLVKLLREEEAGARVTAAAALRNLAIANVENQAAVVRAGAIKPLVDLLYDVKAGAQEDAAFMLANLAANNANHRTWIAKAGAIAPLIELLDSPAVDLQEAASMVLRNLAGDNPENAVKIVEAGAIPSLVRHVSGGPARVRKQAAWALWNLGTASSENFAAVVQARAVGPIVKELGDSPAARGEIQAMLLKLAADYRDDAEDLL